MLAAEMLKTFTDRVSRERKVLVTTRPSVRPFVSSNCNLSNRLTFILKFLFVYV